MTVCKAVPIGRLPSNCPPDSLILAMPGRASLPGPNLIGALGQQLRLLVDRVTTLAAAFDDLALTCKDRGASCGPYTDINKPDSRYE